MSSVPSSARSVAADAVTTCRPARSKEELAAHHAVRHEVFVEEQAIFTGSDRDDHDSGLETIRVVGYVDGRPAGAVRLFPLDPSRGMWQGDRLAVRRGFRTHGLGGPLVRFAVATAGMRGGAVMVAHVQLPNVAFFTRLGWRAQGDPEEYVGLPHQQMTIELPAPEDGAAIVRSLGG